MTTAAMTAATDVYNSGSGGSNDDSGTAAMPTITGQRLQ